MKLTKGKMVIVRGIQSNGHDDQPAVITHVFTDDEPAGTKFVTANLMVFPDNGTPVCHNSIACFESGEAAGRHRQAHPLPEMPIFAYLDLV